MEKIYALKQIEQIFFSRYIIPGYKNKEDNRPWPNHHHYLTKLLVIEYT